MAKVKLLDPSDPRRKLDRYELIGEIATGGMATVFLARRGGVGGFQRFVAIKRLHPHLANEPEFVEMFLDEARLAALIHHPNVVPILEVGESEAGYYLVMEYVEGDTLSKMVARTMSLGKMPPRHVTLRVLLDALAGLHAAHELKDDRGQLLGLVHRDCSPQNVLVGVDGTARITDFGVARASSRLTSTAHGKLKGKLAYMAPEQTRGDELDRRTDLFAMGIITWEVLCGKRLFKADSEAATLQRILVEPVRRPSEQNPDVPRVFDDVILRALDRDPDKRYQTAADLADALEAAARESAKISATDVGVASPREVASFMQQVLGQEIGAQRESVRAWLAQSDSGQEFVIGGPTAPAGRPPNTRSPIPMQQGAVAVTIAGQEARSPEVHFEVAADVTMRFALEQPKGEPPPAPVPPPRSEGPPMAPPPPKQSQPTLIGQGPDRISDRPAAMSGAQMSDDLAEDLPTVARGSSHPPAPILPEVKTQRGMFLGGLAVPNEGEDSRLGPRMTPRMPMLADRRDDDKAGHASGPPGGILEVAPLNAPLPPQRTLVSSTNEFSNGGFTPGSMTLPSDGLGAQDATVIHTKPSSKKWVVAGVALGALMVVGAGIFVIQWRGSGERAAERVPAVEQGNETTRKTAQPTGKPEGTQVLPSAEPTAAVSASGAPTSAPEDVSSAEPITKDPTPTQRVRPRTSATASAAPAKSAAPSVGEDLSNPYR